MFQLPPYDEVKQFFPYHRKEIVKNFRLLAAYIFQSRSKRVQKQQPSRYNDRMQGLIEGKCVQMFSSIFFDEM
jgi:hypothetical protein